MAILLHKNVGLQHQGAVLMYLPLTVARVGQASRLARSKDQARRGSFLITLRAPPEKYIDV
jgi:hypothetical protein